MSTVPSKIVLFKNFKCSLLFGNGDYFYEHNLIRFVIICLPNLAYFGLGICYCL